MSDYVPTEEEERAFSDAMDAEMLPTATVEYWVYAAVAQALEGQQAKNSALQDEIDSWKTSSLLVDGGGDPSDITPTQNEQNVYNLMQENARLRAALTPFLAHWGERERDVFADLPGHTLVRCDASVAMMNAAFEAMSGGDDGSSSPETSMRE